MPRRIETKRQKNMILAIQTKGVCLRGKLNFKNMDAEARLERATSRL